MSSATVCKRGGGRGGGMSRGAGLSRRGMHSGSSRSANNAAAAHAASYIDPQLTCQQFWDVNRDMLRKLGVSGPASINVSIEKDAKGWRIRFVLPHLSLVSCKSLQKQQLATSYKKAHHKERKVLVIIESDAATTSVADTLRDWGLSVEEGPARPAAAAAAAAAATPVSATNKPARPALAEISNARVPPPFTHHARPARDLMHGHSTPQPMGSWASAGTCTPPPRSHDSNSPRPDMPGMLMPGLVSLPSSATSTPCNGPHVTHELPPLYSMDTAPDTSVSLASLAAPLSVSQRKSMSPKALRMLPPSRHVPPPTAAAAAAAAVPAATTPAASTVKVPPSHYHPPSAPQGSAASQPQTPQQHALAPQQPQPQQAQAQAVAPQATTHNPYGTSPMSVSAQPQPCLQPTSLSAASPHVPTPTSAQRACPTAAAAAAAAPIPVPTLQQQGVTHLPCATANESVTIVDATRSTTTFSVMQTSADSKLVWSGGVNGHTIVKKVRTLSDPSGVSRHTHTHTHSLSQVTLNYGSRIELQVDSNTVCLHFPDALESVKKLKQMCEKIKSVACNIDLQWKANDACWKRTTTTNVCGHPSHKLS